MYQCPGVLESDWRLFRKLLPKWHEAHMEKLIVEYSALLATPGAASDKFWELEKRIRKDKKSVGVIARISRSEMNTNILNLLGEGIITLDDLADFSEDLRGVMEHLSVYFKDEKNSGETTDDIR